MSDVGSYYYYYYCCCCAAVAAAAALAVSVLCLVTVHESVPAAHWRMLGSVAERSRWFALQQNAVDGLLCSRTHQHAL